MYAKNVLLSLALLSGACLSANAQSFVPPNMDFELGTTANWTFYRGMTSSGHVYTLTTCSPVFRQHTLTSGTGTEHFGGFPVVDMGSYSFKLGFDTSNNNADAASYNINIPAGTTSYQLIYDYAAVLEDPGHLLTDMPVFEVTATDSATGLALPSSTFIDCAYSGGYTLDSIDIKHKPWTSESIDLTGYEGRTVTVKFFTSACATGGHWGYGYFDVSGCFERSMPRPAGPSTTVHGPSGYSSYRWTDSATYSASLGTTATASIPSPTVTTTYALIVTPFAGHGTIDTFFTTVRVDATLGTSTIHNASQGAFNIFPNPTSGAMKVQWTNQSTGAASLEISDVTGRVISKSVLNMDVTSGVKEIDLGGLNDGVYFVNIKSDKVDYSGKVVVQK